MLPWVREAVAVFIKELRTEWRTRVALSGTALFALSTLTLIGVSLAGQRVGIDVVSALVWLLLVFTAVTGLGRAFVQEAERGTALALRLHCRATAVYIGKSLANLVFLGTLLLIAVPALLAIVAFDAPRANPAALVCVLLVGSMGVTAVVTLMGGLLAASNARGGLLAALSFPVLAPALMAGVNGTKAALGYGAAAGRTWEHASGNLEVLAAFAVTAVAASLMLFDYVWND
jgi:heme exporter protein B